MFAIIRASSAGVVFASGAESEIPALFTSVLELRGLAADLPGGGSDARAVGGIERHRVKQRLEPGHGLERGERGRVADQTSLPSLRSRAAIRATRSRSLTTARPASRGSRPRVASWSCSTC